MNRRADWPKLEILSPLLAALPAPARRDARMVEIPAAAQLFARGERPTNMYFVVSGEIRLVRRSRTGIETILQRTAHGFFAEASLDQPAYHCDAIAVMASRALKVPRKAFSDSLAEEVFRTCWISHLSRELRRVRTHAERLNLRSASERIIHFIESEGDKGAITLSCSRKDWATELGLTHEALYRTLARMQRTGRLISDGPSFVLRD